MHTQLQYSHCNECVVSLPPSLPALTWQCACGSSPSSPPTTSKTSPSSSTSTTSCQVLKSSALLQWNLRTLGPAFLSFVERLSSFQMNYCYGKGVQKGVLSWEVVPFLEVPVFNEFCFCPQRVVFQTCFWSLLRFVLHCLRWSS